MGFVKFASEKLRDSLRSWLDIQPAPQIRYSIFESADYNGIAARNRIWYRGDSWELSQLYSQYHTNTYCFWAAQSSTGMEIRKIHIGLPQIIVKILASMVVSDANDIAVDAQRSLDWKVIEKGNNLHELLTEAISDTLYIGDGAFKISIEPGMTAPIIEYYPGDMIDISHRRGRVTEITFRTPLGDGSYTLLESYGVGYIKSRLYRGTSEVPLGTLPGTKGIEPDIELPGNVMLAVPLRFFPSAKYKCRGESIYNAKIDDFDTLDEIWSQWMHALRSGRSKEYVPKELLPTDPMTGEVILRSNPFDHIFIATEPLMTETASENKGKVQLVQPVIPHESYLSTYITALDLCLQGIISPSTIGIDVKKLDNAEAQREKEKATLYTRNAIIDAISEAFPKVIDAAIKAYDIFMCDTAPTDTKSELTFGEYANPSFESQVETIGKARTQGVMSVEASIDELYGDTKDPKWKDEEARIIRPSATI